MMRLKIILLKKKVKQADLANMLGIDDSLLSKYVTGRREMPEEIKGKIAMILQVKKSELFE